MPTPIIIKGNRYASANVNMNVIITSEITSEVPRKTLNKKSKISYNIFICKFIKIIFKKLRVYLLALLFGSEKVYLL